MDKNWAGGFEHVYIHDTSYYIYRKYKALINQHCFILNMKYKQWRALDFAREVREARRFSLSQIL